MPGYFKKDQKYIVTIVTGPAHVYLGLKFGEKNNSNIEIVSLPPVGACIHGELNEAEILQHAIEGVETANNKLDGCLQISEIEYIQDDTPRYDIYRRCAFLIAEGVLNNETFKEIA